MLTRNGLQLPRGFGTGLKPQYKIEAVSIRTQLEITLGRPGRVGVEEFARARRLAQPPSYRAGIEILTCEPSREQLCAQIILIAAFTGILSHTHKAHLSRRKMHDVSAYRGGIDKTSREHYISLRCVDETLGTRVRGMYKRSASEILLLDMCGRVAEIETLEFAGVAFAERDELWMTALQAARFLDVADRDDALGTICEGVAGNGKSAEHVNDHGDTTRCASSRLEVEDLYFWMPKCHLSLAQPMPVQARAACACAPVIEAAAPLAIALHAPCTLAESARLRQS